jgi:hypothetical protein
MFSCLREDGVQKDSRNHGYPNHEFSVLSGSEEYAGAMILFLQNRSGVNISLPSLVFSRSENRRIS